MTRPIMCAAIILTFLVSGWMPASAQPALAAGSIEVAPERVGIDLNYNGATVYVRAEVPPGYEAAVRLEAHPTRLEMKRLGRRGVLWMGVGQVTFENVPAVYQVLTSAPLSELGTAKSLAEWKLGYDSLVPDGAPGAALRQDLVGLKEHEGLFALQPRGLSRSSTVSSQAVVAPVSAGSATAAAVDVRPQLMEGSFHLPARAPTGEYTVELIGFKNGQAVNLGSTTLRLEYVGWAMELRKFATQHGLAYGISSCVIAIFVGLLTGLLFRPKSDESH